LLNKRLIGINGGTFDPIHFGHLRPALEVLNYLSLDEVRFVPAYKPVHRGLPCVSAEHRCEMVRLAIKRQPKFVLDTLEVERKGHSYMVDTLSDLKVNNPDSTLVLMMGTDAFAKFDKWHQWQRVLEMANIVVMRRPSCNADFDDNIKKIIADFNVKDMTENAGQLIELSVTQLDLSATALRTFLQNNQPVDYLMPASVVEYIKNNNLYGKDNNGT
jgi:nicotinate-nucleotide adenylyltransferase